MKNLILKSIYLLIISLLLPVMVQGQTNTYVGYYAGHYLTTGKGNSLFGTYAGVWLETGWGNSYFGDWVGGGKDVSRNSMFGCDIYTAGDENCQFGYQAGEGNDGSGVSIFGYQSGHVNTADYSSFYGYMSGYSNRTGVGNSFFGNLSGYSNTEGQGNSFFGDNAGTNNTLGITNSFFGAYSGSSNTLGSTNSFFGFASGYKNTIGGKNVFFGYNAGYNNSTASENAFFGYGAGVKNTEGGSNTFLGYYAGCWNTTGESNVFIGNSAGYSNVTGSNNVSIGWRAYLTGDYSIVLGAQSETTASSAVVIGYDVKSTLDNTCVIGGVDTTNSLRVGIGTLEPNEMATLELGNTDKGFLISRMTTTERTTFGESLGTPEEGMMVYDMNENSLYVWDGGAWIKISNSDNQNLDLTGSTLSISDGNSVDLSSLLDDINARIAVLEALHGITSNKSVIEENTAVLYQNAPNPFKYDTSIDFYIPDNTFDAKFLIYNVNGQLVKQVDINQRGNGSVIITRDMIATGTYFYTLSMDNVKLDTKIMVLVE